MRIEDNTVANAVSIGDRFVRGNDEWMLVVTSNANVEVGLICINGTHAGHLYTGKSTKVGDAGELSECEFMNVTAGGGTNTFTPQKKQEVDMCIHIESLDELCELWGRMNAGSSDDAERCAFRSLKYTPSNHTKDRMWKILDDAVRAHGLHK